MRVSFISRPALATISRGGSSGGASSTGTADFPDVRRSDPVPQATRARVCGRFRSFATCLSGMTIPALWCSPQVTLVPRGLRPPAAWHRGNISSFPIRFEVLAPIHQTVSILNRRDRWRYLKSPASGQTVLSARRPGKNR